ncbi:MAG: pyruvate carboxylase subunit B, partial [Deltaproteobacteria bacterium]|nr:pyruvate carboxylase subunit B [Deltaproteobacteria bacterium]
QSLWGYMMRTDMITPIAETMDQVGYKAIATVGSQAFTVLVRNLNEDPWERIRSLSQLLKRTPLRGSYQTGSLSTFDLSTPRDIISLWIKRSVANGIKCFWVCDWQDDMDRFVYFARIARDEGAKVVTTLGYSLSPVHTDEFWVQKAELIAETKDYVDAIMIEDGGGLLTPERTRALVSAIQKNCDGIPLEFHAHCNSGLAPLCYLEAIKLGVTTVHTAIAPLANGTSLPATETILRNARRLGFTSDLNEDALAAVSAHFRKIAEQEGLPIGVPAEYDLFHFEHQVPGGMMANLTRQLREVKMEDRLDEILEEIVQVRAEIGYPVMGTPFSQIVGAQAIENIISGERYGKITDEVIKYTFGYYGAPIAPIDQNVMDKIMSMPRSKEFLDWKPKGYDRSIEELRLEHGPELSDDELLLNILIPGKAFKPGEASKEVKLPDPKASIPSSTISEFPAEFSVDVDGEVFNVKILPVMKGEGKTEVSTEEKTSKVATESEELPAGAVLSGMPGMVLSIEVKIGDRVEEGQLVAVIEAMKMKRLLNSPHGGVVKKIMATEGETIDSEDILMVVG